MWLEKCKKWIKERGSLVLISILIQLVITSVFALLGYFEPVQAAKEAPPTVTACVVVNTTDVLQISRCTDVDRSVIFYVNNVGWMMPDPY